ncbi:MAG: MTAP family purine nucleoside phosphorylase, partial [Anaerolineae bacterium]|nr:MTAP family purine nucleoside phosphorylase [Anaerolineae bacterium]
VPDQLVDLTRDRKRTFFEDGVVVHVAPPEPFCPNFSSQVYNAVKQVGAQVHQECSLIAVEGPRFSTRFESNLFRNWGLDVIGMTSAPEAFLAREAEICYGAIAHVTDYDVWHTEEEPVSVEMIVQILQQNKQAIQQAIRNLLEHFDPARTCDCPQALSNAIATDPDRITNEMRDRLGIFINKYLDN